MPTCQQCSSSIISLVPQWIQILVRQQMQLVRGRIYSIKCFRPEEAATCWICAKFLKWLETEHPKLAQSCHIRPISMDFSIDDAQILKNHRLDSFTFEINMTVTVQGSNRLFDPCKVGLFLVPVAELHPNSLTLFKRRTLGSNLAVARAWISQCEKEHAECARNMDSYYPTRLLQIDRQTKKVSLINSKSHCPSGRYITLSHRWGKFMPVKLQTSTMAKLQNGVSPSALPQSFQDAIAVTDHLNISYLWIDALCILQDNDSIEWNIEAQNMAKVYSNAFLNISATMASTGQESLLHERCSDAISPSKISLFSSSQKDYYIVDSQIWEDEIDRAPLNQRGWVFQERFLARRILHFGSRQLAWECREFEALEMFPKGLNQFFKILSPKKSKTYQRLCCPPQASEDTQMLKFAREFHTLVHDYSRCHLTRYQDKLIAFSGIPKAIQDISADAYHVGVWHRTLPFDLSWFQYDDEQDGPVAVEPAFPAPTWSWASAAGEVEFPLVLDDSLRILIAHWRFNTVRTRGSNFGNNTSITLKGILLPMQFSWSEGEISGFKIFDVQFGQDEADMLVKLDGPEKDIKYLDLKDKIKLLPLFVTSEELHGLLVGKLSRGQTYRRLGTLRIPIQQRLQSVPEHNGPDQKPTVRMTRSTHASLAKEARAPRIMELAEAQSVVEVVIV